MGNPDFELNGIERAHLATLVTTDGFQIFQRIMESEVERFNYALLNTSAANSDAVLAAHNLAKAAAQFYTGIIKRLNGEIEQYRLGPKADDKPIDGTEGLIDLGELTTEEI